MNRETLQYCAYLKENKAFWDELIAAGKRLIEGREGDWDVCDGGVFPIAGRLPSEDPVEDFLNEYSFPSNDEDLKFFTEAFLSKVDDVAVCSLICDAADGGFYFKDEHQEIDRIIAGSKDNVIYLEAWNKREKKERVAS